MAFRLATLGRCNLEDEAGNVVNVPAQSLLLAAYLLDVGKPVRRRDAANLLWPGNPDAASTNLRSTLRRFSQATLEASSPVMLIDTTHISVDRQVLSGDFDITGTPVERLKALCDAVAMQFLPGFGEGKAGLDVWIRDVRLRILGDLRAQFLDMINLQQRHPDAHSDLKRAAILLLEADPDDHDIRALLSSGLSTRPLEPATVPATPMSFAETVQPVAQTFAQTLSGHPRIALLPPAAATGTNPDGRIADALIEDLTIGLCSSRTVSVVAPYTSARIQASKDKAAVLERHKVVYALDSRRNDTHLFMQLIFTPTEEIIWAGRFELSPIAVASHRIDIAAVIQRELTVQIGSHQNARADFSKRPEAYFLYLKGLQSLSNINLPSVRRARKYFKEALEHGNDFSEAFAGLSRTLSVEWLLTARGDDQLLIDAERLADRAIAVNEESSNGYKELGVSRLFMGKIDDSLAALSQAETLSPQYADVLCSYADTLNHNSDPASSIIKIKQAIDLNPISPDIYYWTAASASYFLNQFDQSLGYINQMSNKRPAARLAAACYGMLGDVDKARVYRARVFEDNPSFDLDRWLAVIPHKEMWQTEMYRDGLKKAGF
ncbi:hypothetical protein [Rhizobium sp. Leaf262]|uniref:hypothetical protein n=1 Tax=Rhizobium sp. Leaf262 TaxID=1736312 RepID=UPI000AF68E9F|nr:hypothetical protein [Rhizobium sp. Leaf262]